ncbi:hypothetical protein Areg01_04830 [Actinoplanes regularis]|nr:hypothetical protein Areg01_04830 [Actinoplanes regularis]
MRSYPFAMRPRLINQRRLEGVRDITSAAGVGWIATEPTCNAVSLFDHDLRLRRRLRVPLDGPRINAAATDRFVVAGDDNGMAAVDHTGKIIWQSAWNRFADNATNRDTTLHIDAQGVLWIRLADAQQLLALDAASGRELNRVPLAGPEAARFLHRPGDARTGLVLSQPYPSPSALISLVDGRIAVHPLDGFDLDGFNPAGSHYLTEDLEGFLSVRDLATESVLAWRHINDLPELPSDLADSTFTDWATFLTDELILISLGPEDSPDDAGQHLLLSARSLRCRSVVRYPNDLSPGSISASERPGRWLTHHHNTGTLRLWQLGDHLDDGPFPGQLSLL